MRDGLVGGGETNGLPRMVSTEQSAIHVHGSRRLGGRTSVTHQNVCRGILNPARLTCSLLPLLSCLRQQRQVNLMEHQMPASQYRIQTPCFG